MNFNLTSEQILIQKTAREFANLELLPGAVERDENKIWPKNAINKMAELGFMGMMVKPEWGGSGMDTISYTIAIEEISKVDASAAVIMSVNNSLVCYLLEKFGNKFLKDKYLKLLASGKKCERCYQILEDVGTLNSHPMACKRCADAADYFRPLSH